MLEEKVPHKERLRVGGKVVPEEEEEKEERSTWARELWGLHLLGGFAWPGMKGAGTLERHKHHKEAEEKFDTVTKPSKGLIVEIN